MFVHSGFRVVSVREKFKPSPKAEHNRGRTRESGKLADDYQGAKTTGFKSSGQKAHFEVLRATGGNIQFSKGIRVP